MSFNWSSYLALAKELAGRSDEAAKRSAVSRAYYYAFHVANNHLKANNIAVDRNLGTHERVWRVYIESSTLECRKIGSDGNRLRVSRRDADYKPDQQMKSDAVERSILEAETIGSNVPLHLPESFLEPPKSIRCKLIQYLKRLLRC